MTAMEPPARRLYTPAEVAQRFRVDGKTVTRWAKAGRIPPEAVVRTLGGHRRMDADMIDALINGTLVCTACRYMIGSPGHRATCLEVTS